ncbi:alpha/beta fold hydrolase [Microbulbifer sp. SSSA002]|uniref:alpha/beta fold hydrolase n=1 Tax=unclassified Microbulbifer TaxID=2619833 RepID=UPI0040393806
MKRKGVAILLGVLAITLLTYVITPTSTLFKFMISAERSIAGLELKQLEVGDLHIEYLHGGSGTPLVLLHGFGADKDNWNRVAGHLSKNFEIIAIDLPGFGNSTSNIELDYDVFSQVARVDKILKALKIEKVDLVGSSMGGYIAGNYAAQFPEKVDNLWLISPFGVAGTERSEMFSSIINGQHPVVLPRTESEFLQLFDFLFVEPPFVPKPIIQHLASKAEARVALNTKIFGQIHRMKNGVPQPDSPLEQTLSAYKGSVLVTWGNKDRVLHVSGANTLKQAISHAEVDLMNNIGHLPMIESPKKTAEAFLSFSAAP